MVQIRVSPRQVGYIPPPPEEYKARQDPRYPGNHLILWMSTTGFGAKTREIQAWCGVKGRMLIVEDDGSLEICETCAELKGESW